MMMLFFAICVGAAFLMQKPLWERLLIVASALPIAVIANVFRIVMTGVIYEVVGRWFSAVDVDQVEHIIHDWAGFLMMPVGLALLLAETWLLSKLLVAPPPRSPFDGRRDVNPALRIRRCSRAERKGKLRGNVTARPM